MQTNLRAAKITRNTVSSNSWVILTEQRLKFNSIFLFRGKHVHCRCVMTKKYSDNSAMIVVNSLGHSWFSKQVSLNHASMWNNQTFDSRCFQCLNYCKDHPPPFGKHITRNKSQYNITISFLRKCLSFMATAIWKSENYAV